MQFRVADGRHIDRKNEASAPRDPGFIIGRTSDYFIRRKIELWQGRHPLQGRSPRPGDIKVRSNDYLCLAGHPHVIESEIAALRAGGHGDAVSRVWIHHERDIIRSFEQRVAALMLAEDAVLCSSGYTANTGLLQSFAARGTPVFLDMKAHISLHEGVVSAGATPVLFRHNDPQSLDRMLATHGPGLVAVDALYSTDGDIAPLKDFVEVCERHGAALIVDETHSFGVQGPKGAGLVVAAGLAERVHFRTVGLSKAVASRGGFIACSRNNAEFFRYESLPAIFSTSVMQHEVAGFDAVLDIVENEEWRRTNLRANHAYLKQGLDALGYNVTASKAQIIALEAGDIRQTTALRDALEARGVFGAIFFPPATPEKRCLIRFTLNCGLGRRELDRIIAVCADIREEVGMAEWRSTKRKAADAAKATGFVEGSAPRPPLDSVRVDRRTQDWQIDRKGGADSYLGTARYSPAAALDNHSTE
ncbi:alpha-hydroxyketone-type quorum-sensing autoinducer synthase [Methylocystis sp.]|uniref:alpha-hydroxyketone-type quorum-sensing autoinducer synthase n=1 Tax=Methylocystis sp. TaxID=1911079 RepID=UPI003DA3481C